MKKYNVLAMLVTCIALVGLSGCCCKKSCKKDEQSSSSKHVSKKCPVCDKKMKNCTCPK